MTKSYEVQLLVPCSAEVGEGPVYDSGAQVLYWVDIPAGRLWRLHEQTGDLRSRTIGAPLGCVTPIEGGGLLLAAGSTLFTLADWSSPLGYWRSLEGAVAEQFNDGKCDSIGRFYVGTVSKFGSGRGSLYRVDREGVRRVATDIRMANGLDWSPDDTCFYHVDSLAQCVVRYRWDTDTGVPRDPIRFITIHPDEGLPDGLTIDAEGFLWLAVWGSSEVRRYDPRGGLADKISLPTPNVSSCRFGGSASNRLFITTAAGHSSTRTSLWDQGGSVFVVETDTCGKADQSFSRGAVPSHLLTA